MSSRCITPEKLSSFRPIVSYSHKDPIPVLLKRYSNTIDPEQNANEKLEPTKKVRKEKVPPFVFDFIDEQPKFKFTRTRISPWLKSSTKISKRSEKPQVVSENPQMKSTKSLKYREFAAFSKQKDNAGTIYKPHIVHFGPRSKMTLYAPQLNAEKEKERGVKSVRNRCTTPNPNQHRKVEYTQNIDFKEKEHFFEERKVAMTYAQKVRKIEALAESFFY